MYNCIEVSEVAGTVETNIYPYAEKTQGLPVCLRGIGGTGWQGYVRETTESCWYKILYCVGGCGRLNYDSVNCELAQGDVFFAPKGYPHEYFPVQKKWEVRWAVFDGCGLEKTLSELGLDKPVVIKGCSLKELNRISDRILMTLRTDRINGIYRCSGLCYDMILELHRLMLDESMPGGDSRNELLLPVLDHIEDNFRRDLPIGELVKISGVSHQYIGRIFRQAMGCSIENHIRKRRLWEAKHLLLETNSQISEIAGKCGFHDAGYFSTVFKRTEGLSPAEYRRKSRNQKDQRK